FDGDGRDDVLVYSRTGGPFRMYSMRGDFFLDPMASFSAGNLAAAAGTGMQVRAGDFNGDGRDDVMVVNPSGQIIYYASVWDGSNDTFWWAFTTRSGFVGDNDQVSVARINDDLNDDVILRNRTTGTTRFYQMAWASGELPALTGVDLGQIAIWPNSLLYW